MQVARPTDATTSRFCIVLENRHGRFTGTDLHCRQDDEKKKLCMIRKDPPDNHDDAASNVTLIHHRVYGMERSLHTHYSTVQAQGTSTGSRK